MKIAVIGAGLFGIASAIKIKERFPNSKVDLFEKKKNILLGVSGKNQFRWHKGYHYPRSQETISECLKSYSDFSKYFKKAKLKSKNYYAISKNDSKIDFGDYLRVLKKNQLDFIVENSPCINHNLIQGLIRVKEELINVEVLRNLSRKYLQELDVNLRLNQNIILSDKFKKNYDYLIVATYENNNELLNKKKFYKYQLVEKIIATVPNHFYQKSFVIMDGNFMCIDPYKFTNFSILGHVNKSIHQTIIGSKPNFNQKYKNVLTNYHNNFKPFSKFNNIKNDFKKFFFGLENLKHRSSFFVTRCTNLYKERTDERLSDISVYNNLISIFSAKWVSCFNIGEKISKLIK